MTCQAWAPLMVCAACTSFSLLRRGVVGLSAGGERRLGRWTTMDHPDIRGSWYAEAHHRMTLIRRELPRSTSARSGRSRSARAVTEDSPDRCHVAAAAPPVSSPSAPRRVRLSSLGCFAGTRAWLCPDRCLLGNGPDKAQQLPR